TRREVGHVIVGAMSLPHFLDHISDGDMIITPGDRADWMVGSLASRFSGTFPNIAGLVLTGGLVPEPSVLRLIDGLGGTDLPVLAVGSDTYRAAATVAGGRGGPRPRGRGPRGPPPRERPQDRRRPGGVLRPRRPPGAAGPDRGHPDRAGHPA